MLKGMFGGTGCIPHQQHLHALCLYLLTNILYLLLAVITCHIPDLNAKHLIWEVFYHLPVNFRIVLAAIAD